jgi:5-methylcytosine-specific restriction endonuclease McrA
MPSNPGQRTYRHTRAWRGSLRTTVLQRDGYRCVLCGHPGDGPKGKGLTLAHWPHTHDQLEAAGLNPNTPDHVITACRHCHGRLDGGRSNGGQRR